MQNEIENYRAVVEIISWFKMASNCQKKWRISKLMMKFNVFAVLLKEKKKTRKEREKKIY